MNPKIIEVKPQADFLLYLHYSNQEIRILDMKPYLDFGIFKELREEKIFRSVKIGFDTVEWANNADLDPEFLYKNSVLLEK